MPLAMPKPQMLLSLRYTSVVSLFGLLFALNSCRHCLIKIGFFQNKKIQHIAEKHPHGLSYFDKSWGRLTAGGDNSYRARGSSQRAPFSRPLGNFKYLYWGGRRFEKQSVILDKSGAIT